MKLQPTYLWLRLFLLDSICLRQDLIRCGLDYGGLCLYGMRRGHSGDHPLLHRHLDRPHPHPLHPQSRLHPRYPPLNDPLHLAEQSGLVEKEILLKFVNL